MGKKAKDFHIVLVLDRSGSMNDVLDSTISGYNEYIDGLKIDDGDAKYTLATFSSGNGWGTDVIDSEMVTYVTDKMLVADVPHLTKQNYVPKGGTPLYDAVAKVIKKIEADYASRKRKPRILVMIMTDGDENASREYNKDKIAALIKEKEEQNWQFGYLGANQDAWAVGSSMGIRKGNTKTYNTSEMGATFKEAYLVTSDARRAHPAQVMWKGESDKDSK